MSDIIGAPLAIEALLAFYLETTFIGVWLFGWDKISKRAHLVSAWLVALASNISALWILIANSFMQHPVGYAIQGGRATMQDFFALLTNPNVLYQFPHVLTAGIALTGFVVMGLSAWHLLRKHESSFFRTSFRWAATYALVGSVLVGVIGHFQGQFLVEHQPLKMAAAEALWETEQPAGFSVIAWADEAGQRNVFDVKIPGVLSFLSYNNFTSKVEGIKDLQAQAVKQYGPGNYIPPVMLNFWAFRIMVGAGTVMVLLSLLAVLWRNQIEKKTGFLRVLLWAPVLPYLAGTFGWVLAETGRWPWIVYGLLKIQDAVSPNVPAWNIAFSLAAFSVLYGVLSVVAFNLAVKHGTGEVKGEAVAG